MSHSSSTSPESVAQSTSKPIAVVASIKPLALIAQDIVGDLGVVDVLVPPTSSPHDYAMKMSDARKLSKADKVIWFGGDLEQFLVKKIKGLESKRVITIKGLPGNHDDHNDPEHQEHKDLHLWLNPILAKQIAEKIGEALITDQQAMGNHSTVEELQSQLKQTLTNYDNLSKELEVTFSSVRKIGFIVYHNAYDHLVEQFNLRQIGYVSVHPEIPVGLKHMAELEIKIANELKRGPVKCLFVESSHQSGSAEEIARRLDLKIRALDILGSNNDVSTYIELMRQVAKDMSSCLQS